MDNYISYVIVFFLGADTVSAKSLSGLKINRSNIEMAVGSLYQLKATVKASGSKIIWKSNNTDIVTVSTTGKLKAKKLEMQLLLLNVEMK